LIAVWVSVRREAADGPEQGAGLGPNRSHYLRAGWKQGSDQNIVMTFGRLGARLGPDHRYYHRVGWEQGSDHTTVITCIFGELGSYPVYFKLIGEHSSDPNVPVMKGSRARPGACPPTGSVARLI
jgi:hypothetical protein